MLRDVRGPFSRSILGFADFRLDDQSATVALIGGDGHAVHSFERDADGSVRILFTTKSDPATTHPLRVINGIDDSPGGKNAD
jgi:hypothetical protein